MSSMPPPPPPPPTTPPPGWGSGPTPGYGSNRNYANFGARLGASLLDGLLYGLTAAAGVIPGIVFIGMAYADCNLDQADTTDSTMSGCAPGQLKVGLLLLGLALIAACALGAWILQWRHLARTGQTWGRRIVGIQVINSDTGMPLGYGRSLGRMLGSAISAWVCYLGYLWMLWDGNKQTWHDKMVNSIVVKV